MKKAYFIIYVRDQERSRDFYKTVLATAPILDVPGMTEFRLSDHSSLGIMPEQGIAKILGTTVPHPETGNGIPRCELYLLVSDPEMYYPRLLEAGGKLISPLQPRPWGDLAAYGADLDGHVVAFAKPMADKS
jgi:predicted enzyme related to lactoylglutathione lyase